MIRESPLHAREYYEKLLHMWKDADQDLLDLIEVKDGKQMIGEIISHYKIVEKLGEVGTDTV